jgi:hypothetical protein
MTAEDDIVEMIRSAVARVEHERVAVDRHTALLFAITEAVEDAIAINNKAESAQGFPSASKAEICAALAAAVRCLAEGHKISKALFLDELSNTELSWGGNEPDQAARAGAHLGIPTGLAGEALGCGRRQSMIEGQITAADLSWRRPPAQSG